MTTTTNKPQQVRFPPLSLLTSSTSLQRYLGLFWEYTHTSIPSEQLNQLSNSFRNLLPLFSSSRTLETSEVFWSETPSPQQHQEEESNENSLPLEFFQKSQFLVHENNSAVELKDLLSQILFWLWDCARNGKVGSPALAIVTHSLPTIRLMNKFKSRG
jgi:hypothetical protein